MKTKQPVSFYILQERWLLACAAFDRAKSGPKQRAALGALQRVLRAIQAAHPRELTPYRSAYERKLEKMAGVKLPRPEGEPRPNTPPKRKRPKKR